MRRRLFLLLTLAFVSGCQLFAPGQPHFQAAIDVMHGPDGTRSWSPDASSPDELAAIHRYLDDAIERGHLGAMELKAHVVWQTDGLLASEPHWRQLAEVNEAAWGMVAYVAAARPSLEAGVHPRDVPPNRQLDWLDTEAEIAVLREGVAAGSTTADSLLRARFDVLHRQRAAGNADADSLLTLLDA